MDLQQPRRIGADPEHRGVREGELARIADEQVQANGEKDVDRDEIADKELIAVGECRRERADRQQGKEDIAAAEAHQTLRPARAPSSPVGRSTSTTMIT